MAYVYQHQRLDTQEIFYIGISNEAAPSYKIQYERAKDNVKSRSRFWRSVVAKTNFAD